MGEPMSDGTPLRVAPVFGGDLDVDAWTARHAAGQVPDAVPYGLDRMAAHGIRLVVPPRPSSGVVARRLRGVVRRSGGGFEWTSALAPPPAADVVLSWDERRGIPLAANRRLRVPVVTGVIWTTDAPPRRRAVRAAVQGAMQRASRVMVLSAAQVAPLVTELGVAEHRVRVVPFGVDADFFTPGTTPRRPDHVVCVGNDRDRAWDDALAAFAALRRRRPLARLTIVSQRVGAVARSAPGVRVIPRLSHVDLRSLLHQADVALVATRPNLHISGITAALEAQACGVPVVASGTPGMEEYAGPTSGLVLVPPGDAAAAGVALTDLLLDTERRDTLGRQGRTGVVQRFSTLTQAGHIAGLVKEAAAG